MTLIYNSLKYKEVWIGKKYLTWCAKRVAPFRKKKKSLWAYKSFIRVENIVVSFRILNFSYTKMFSIQWIDVKAETVKKKNVFFRFLITTILICSFSRYLFAVTDVLLSWRNFCKQKWISEKSKCYLNHVTKENIMNNIFIMIYI